MDGTDLAMTALDPVQLGLIALIAFAASILGGISAFGTGLLVTPFLVPVLGIKAVVPVMAVAMTFGNLSRAWANWRQMDRRIAFLILLPAVPGIILGTKIYDWLPAHVLSVVVGFFLLVSIPARRVLGAKVARPSTGGLLGLGGVYGLVSGAVPGGGILLLPMLLGLGIGGGGVIGTDGLIGVATSGLKMIMFGVYDLLSVQLFLAGVLIGLFMLPGAFLAKRIVDRLHVRVHTALIEVLVAVGGLMILWDGIANWP